LPKEARQADGLRAEPPTFGHCNKNGIVEFSG
jgi:hypothetical protein